MNCACAPDSATARFFARGDLGVRCCCAGFNGAATQQTSRDDCVTRGRYCLFATTRRAGFRNSNWGAHLLYCCRETRNRGFQFRDPLLLLLEFIEARLRLGAPGTAYSHLLPTGIHRGRAQVTIGIDVHGEGAGTNGRHENATDKRFRKEFRWRQSRRWNHILIAVKARIADVNIIAANAGIGTRASAYGVVEMASAILKRRVAHRSVVASVSIGLQRERAHSGIVSTVVVIDDGGCSKGAVPCARSVE